LRNRVNLKKAPARLLREIFAGAFFRSCSEKEKRKMSKAAMPPPLLTERQAAEFLHVVPGTLAGWRSTGRVRLPYTKIGRSVRYNVGDLERFARDRTIHAEEQ
jgi:hypothetical protein